MKRICRTSNEKTNIKNWWNRKYILDSSSCLSFWIIYRYYALLRVEKNKRNHCLLEWTNLIFEFSSKGSSSIRRCFIHTIIDKFQHSEFSHEIYCTFYYQWNVIEYRIKSNRNRSIRGAEYFCDKMVFIWNKNISLEYGRQYGRAV